MSKIMTEYLAKKAQADAIQEEARKLYMKARAEELAYVIAKIKEFGFNKRELRLPARERASIEPAKSRATSSEKKTGE